MAVKVSYLIQQLKQHFAELALELGNFLARNYQAGLLLGLLAFWLVPARHMILYLIVVSLLSIMVTFYSDVPCNRADIATGCSVFMLTYVVGSAISLVLLGAYYLYLDAGYLLGAYR